MTQRYTKGLITFVALYQTYAKQYVNASICILSGTLSMFNTNCFNNKVLKLLFYLTNDLIFSIY
jgi:hypothetical protein